MGMISRAQLALMKPTAFFISTARGGIHSEDDLAEALRAGKIAGAGLDVFLEEPPPPVHRLLAFDTVIATPHIAGVTEEALYDTAAATAEQWIAIFAGSVPPRLVNPAAWPRYAERFERLLGLAPGPLDAPSLEQMRARLESRSEVQLSVSPADAVRAERDRS